MIRRRAAVHARLGAIAYLVGADDAGRRTTVDARGSAARGIGVDERRLGSRNRAALSIDQVTVVSLPTSAKLR